MKIHFVIPVWGKSYTNSYLQASLPNHLAPGNLPMAAQMADCVYKIYTSSKYAELIRENSNFKKAQNYARTEIIVLDHLFDGENRSVPNSLLLMTQAHAIAIASAACESAVISFLPPDMVFSGNALGKCIEIILSGKRVVATTGVRLIKETFLPEFTKYYNDENNSISLEPRQLVKLAMRNLHPMMKDCFINAQAFDPYSILIIWRSLDGILVRTLHPHILMISPRRKFAIPVSAFDTDYIVRACPDFKDYHLVTDSDEFAAFEVSEKTKGASSVRSSAYSPWNLSRQINHHGNRIHRKFLNTDFKIHAGDLTSGWSDLESQSSTVIKKAKTLALLKRMFGF